MRMSIFAVRGGMTLSMRIHALILIAAFLCAPLIAANPTLSPRFRTVYILEMANGLDQHLANRFTAGRAMWVVLEPGAADAVLTESLDDSFWLWLARNYTPPAQAQPGGSGSASRREPSVNPRHPGMVFLVDPRTRVVLWSTWEKPKNSSPAELENSASRIASQLKAAFAKK
jgi:hypothetical protein